MGMFRTTLDKLPGIGAAFVRLDNSWQEWKFGQFAETLKQWTERNPINNESKTLDKFKRDRVLNTKQFGNKTKGCIYCNKEDHKPLQCKSVTDTNERRKIPSEKKLCFNCTGGKHRASECQE